MGSYFAIYSLDHTLGSHIYLHPCNPLTRGAPSSIQNKEGRRVLPHHEGFGISSHGRHPTDGIGGFRTMSWHSRHGLHWSETEPDRIYVHAR